MNNLNRLTEGLDKLFEKIHPTTGESVAVLTLYLATLLKACREDPLVLITVQLVLSSGAESRREVEDLFKRCGVEL